MFGDDRVRGTREQRMLQVDLVRHRAEAGLVLCLAMIMYAVHLEVDHVFK